MDTLGPGSSLTAALDAYLIARAPRKDSPNTTAALRRDVAGLARRLADVLETEPEQLRIEHLTLKALRQAFAEFAHDHARASIGRAWSTWNGLCTFLVTEGVIEGNPMSGVARPRPERTQPKALRGEDTPEQLLQAIAAGVTAGRNPWPERDLAILTVLLVAGLRSAELLELRVRDLAGAEDEPRLHVRGKGNAERSVPIEPVMAELLHAYLDSRRDRFATAARLPGDAALFVSTYGTPLTRNQLQYLVRCVYRRAGIHDRVPQGALVHALRHTFATRVVASGGSAVEVMRLLGHQSLTTSQRYIDAAATELRTAAAGNPLYRTIAQLPGVAR
ncbi:tyrosine-type recombinase/integrase [Kineococcus sp. SYSU DK006]|uniref:tyrosine-type recombinase/integrase n=1 Tax=Kineococcus sp. SYSU DK006 TaxID=3383127 RepID=UPI003D7DFAEE